MAICEIYFTGVCEERTYIPYINLFLHDDVKVQRITLFIAKFMDISNVCRQTGVRHLKDILQ